MLDEVTGDNMGERAGRQGLEHDPRERRPRHRDQRAGHPEGAQLRKQLARAGTPRDVTGDPFDDGTQQGLDHRRRAQRHRGIGEEELRRDQQILADEFVSQLLRPGAAVLLNEGVFRVDPIGLRVDERAVHVPEHRVGQRGRAQRNRLSSRGKGDLRVYEQALPRQRQDRRVAVAAAETPA